MKYAIILIAFFLSPVVQAQKFTVKGVVSDAETKEPIPFATVMTKLGDSRIGTKTDFDGEYTLILPHGGEWELSYTMKPEGYVDKTLTIIAKPNSTLELNIALQKSADIQNLEAVMVKGTKSRRKTTTIKERRSSSSVDALVSTPGVSKNSSSVQLRARRNKSNHFEDNARFNEIQDNTFVKVKRAPLSTFSIDVDKGAYTQMRRLIRSNQLPHPDLVRIEEFVNYFDYDYSQPTDGAPFAVITEYSECPWNKQHKLALIALQGEQKEMDQESANNLVFLLDVSGSMQGSDRIELIKSGMKMLVDELRPQDRITIITYAGSPSPVIEAAKGSEKKRIKDAITNLTAAGSTNGSGAIQLAYEIAEKNFKKNGNNRIILATDGDFNVGTTNEKELIKIIEEKREDGVFLSILGVGTGNFQDGKMEQLADHGNGNYYYLDNILEAKRCVVTGMQGLLYTIAKDVKLQVEFNPEHVQSYRLIGYANRMLAEEDFNDDTKDAGELGSGHTVTAIYEIIPTGVKEEASPDVDPLKYQEEKVDGPSKFSDELLTVKLRYKEPDGDTSKLISIPCPASFVPMKNASENIQFASAVVEYGLLLRNSEHKGDASYQSVIKRAKYSTGKDEDGLRAEFIQLVESAELLESERTEE
ncbi:MAG: von Willebrand factor type A domain-containing protein [Fluviicola sp.]